MVDKLRVVHPTSDITTTVALRRVDDAFFIHHCDGSPGYLLHPARLRRVDSLRSPFGPAFGCYSASLRSLAPSLFLGHAAKGHPWPIAALAASMPLNPLHNDSTRPPDGAFGVVCEIGVVMTDSSHALRGSLPATLRVAHRLSSCSVCGLDAGASGRRSHAERGNDQQKLSCFFFRPLGGQSLRCVPSMFVISVICASS